MGPKPYADVVQEVITVGDIVNQIQTNAEVLFPDQADLKVVSSQSASGVLYYTTIVASDPKTVSKTKAYKTILSVSGGKSRRTSMMALLDETERRMTEQVLKKQATTTKSVTQPTTKPTTKPVNKG